MNIESVYDPSFKPYGQILTGYDTTLHYAPCHVDKAEGFRVAVVLPKGTNDAKPSIALANDEDRRLWLYTKAQISEVAGAAPTTGTSGISALFLERLPFAKEVSTAEMNPNINYIGILNLLRQLVDTVKVLSENTIVVYLRGGIEIQQSIQM